jgi:hypothetical protein
VASINCISAVYIRADEEALARVCSEGICLVGTRMSSQNSVVVDIVRVCLAPPRVICWKAQGVEVLVCGDDGEEGVVVSIGRGREFRFNDRTRYGDGVVFLNM